MIATDRSLFALTAADLMSRDVVRLTADLPLREAARLLYHAQVSGAPVVDDQGKCVGVLSAADFLRLAEGRDAGSLPVPTERAVTCSFQTKYRDAAGTSATLCKLAPGACPLQRKRQTEAGMDLLVCTEPNCAMVDWQVVGIEKLPGDAVRQFMTADPVTAPPATPLRALARMMTDAHVHRVIVVDEDDRPVGVVSSTDLLAALAGSAGDN